MQTKCHKKKADNLFDKKQKFVDAVKEAGIETDHYNTDLYIPKTAKTVELLKKVGLKVDGHNIQQFRSDIDGKMYFELPFMYNKMEASADTNKIKASANIDTDKIEDILSVNFELSKDGKITDGKHQEFDTSDDGINALAKYLLDKIGISDYTDADIETVKKVIDQFIADQEDILEVRTASSMEVRTASSNKDVDDAFKYFTDNMQLVRSNFYMEGLKFDLVPQDGADVNEDFYMEFPIEKFKPANVTRKLAQQKFSPTFTELRNKLDNKGVKELNKLVDKWIREQAKEIEKQEEKSRIYFDKHKDKRLRYGKGLKNSASIDLSVSTPVNVFAESYEMKQEGDKYFVRYKGKSNKQSSSHHLYPSLYSNDKVGKWIDAHDYVAIVNDVIERLGWVEIDGTVWMTPATFRKIVQAIAKLAVPDMIAGTYNGEYYTLSKIEKLGDDFDF